MFIGLRLFLTLQKKSLFIQTSCSSPVHRPVTSSAHLVLLQQQQIQLQSQLFRADAAATNCEQAGRVLSKVFTEQHGRPSQHSVLTVQKL